MATDGERIATIEALLAGLRSDVTDLTDEMNRSRTRLHNLEGFAQAYLDTQREHRHAEDRQYRRIANSIALGGLLMAVAMVALTVVTLLVHAN